MKKGVLLAVCLLLTLRTASVHAQTYFESFAEPVLTPSLEFSAEYDQEKNHVRMDWKVWEEDLMWYKLVRSQENPDPIYPDDGYIYYSSDQNETSYIDRSPPRGNVFYRICAITFAKEVYCSRVQKINTETAPDSEPVFCIQVITPAIDSASGECKEFPTPCDVPDSWETVDACPEPDCDEGVFYAVDPSTNECLEYSNSCEIPEDFLPTDSCEEDIDCLQVITPAIDSASGECKEFPTACDVPEGWSTYEHLTSCEDIGTIELSVEQAEEAAYITWSFSGKGEVIDGFEILKATAEDVPQYPDDAAFFVGRTDAFVYLDEDIEPEQEYAYAICALTPQGKCFPISETLPFVASVVPKIEFIDVSSDSEMGSAILEYANKGVVNGFDDGTFHPEKQVTRAELAKMATLVVGVSPDIPEIQIFCDVPTDQWFAPFVHYFSENAFASGFEGGDCASCFCFLKKRGKEFLFFLLLKKNVSATSSSFSQKKIFSFLSVLRPDHPNILGMKSNEKGNIL
jgi:hypothetical protein